MAMTLMVLLLGLLPSAASTSAAAGRCLVQMNKDRIRDNHTCALLAEDDCTYKTESSTANFQCQLEHASRLMYLTWIRPHAKVLEVGARYGQSSCLLSRVLQRESGAVLFSSDADPKVWDVLEKNQKDHDCWGSVVRGPVGQTDIKVTDAASSRPIAQTYGRETLAEDDPRPGRVVKAVPVSSLNTTFDTLAIDCEGCFANFLDENPDLMQSLSMIVAEIHDEEDNKVVQQLIAEGWELKQAMRRQRVLCKGHCKSMCHQKWVKDHAETYWNGDVEPRRY